MAEWKKVIVSGSRAELQDASGSFSGSFEGDGSGLTNVPASGVIGLSLDQIATTNVTASVSEGADSFKLVSGSETPFKIGNDGVMTGTGSGLINLKATETDLQQTLTANQTVGGVTDGDSFAAGTDVEDLLRQILITYIQPSLSGLRMQLNGSNNDTTPREPGNAFNINTASFSAAVDNPNGDFPFSSSFTSSGALISDVKVYFGDDVLGSSNPLGIGNTYEYDRSSPGNITFRVNAKDNEANTITTTKTVTFLYPYFYYKSTSPITTAGMIDAIENGDATKVVASSTGTLSIPYNVSAEYLAVAYPSTSTTKTVYYVTANDNGVITAVFNAVDTQNVDSPDSYWSGVSYKIHTSKNAITNSNPTIQLKNS